MIDFVKEKSEKHKKIIRFLIAGGSAAFINIATFSILAYHFHVWYIYSGITAYCTAFFFSFFLHKFWTFEGGGVSMKRELVFYLIVFLLGNFLNSYLLFVFVEYFLFHSLLAQILSNAIIAVVNYFAYNRFVFKK